MGIARKADIGDALQILRSRAFTLQPGCYVRSLLTEIVAFDTMRSSLYSTFSINSYGHVKVAVIFIPLSTSQQRCRAGNVYVILMRPCVDVPARQPRHDFMLWRQMGYHDGQFASMWLLISCKGNIALGREHGTLFRKGSCVTL